MLGIPEALSNIIAGKARGCCSSIGARDLLKCAPGQMVADGGAAALYIVFVEPLPLYIVPIIPVIVSQP